MILPPALTTLDDEALAGCAADVVELPEGLTFVGTRALADCPDLRFVRVAGMGTDFEVSALEGSAQAVLLCHADSLAFQAAKDEGWQYVIQ